MPGSDDRRLAVVAYLAPFVVATVGAALTQVHIGTLWTASMLTLFPVVLLSSPLLEVSRRNVAGFAAAAFAVCLGALAMAPIVALVTLRSGGEYDATHMRGLTAEVESTWRATTNRPVPLVVGPYHHANVVAFYLPDRPRALALFPRLTKELIVDPDMTRDGFVLVCPAHWSDTANWDCTDELAGFLPQSRPTLQRNVILTPGWLGVLGVPRRFSISIFAPRP
jgi:hypothetical protein